MSKNDESKLPSAIITFMNLVTLNTPMSGSLHHYQKKVFSHLRYVHHFKYNDFSRVCRVCMLLKRRIGMTCTITMSFSSLKYYITQLYNIIRKEGEKRMKGVSKRAFYARQVKSEMRFNLL